MREGAEAEGWKDRRTGWWEFGRLKWRLLAVLQGRRRGRRSECEVTEGRQSEPPAGDTGKSRPCSREKLDSPWGSVHTVLAGL